MRIGQGPFIKEVLNNYRSNETCISIKDSIVINRFVIIIMCVTVDILKLKINTVHL